MISVRERSLKDGTVAYTVAYRFGGRGSRQGSLTFSSRAAAEAFAAAVKAHGAERALTMHGIDPRPARVAVPAPPLTVADWIREYIDAKTGIEQYTRDKDTEYLAGIEAEPIGAIPLTKLTFGDITVWLDALAATGGTGRRGRPNGAKTIANKHGFLSAALNAAVRAGKIPSNPAQGRRLPKRKASEAHEMRMLTRAEFDRLHAATAPSWRPMIAFMVSSGMRWGEIAALEPRHVDPGTGTVKVRQAWKYSPSGGYELGEPKTRRSRRTINLPARILDDLDLSGEWVFTNQRDGGPVRYPAFRRYVWDPAVVRAKLDPAPTPHDMRHTCASWLLTGGVPLTTVSRHLGHENVSVTADVYGDVDRTAFKAAADTMAALMK